MSDAHGEELLAAIRAAPDDRALRLVYADWLMERGDPRGEWIALSCGQKTEDTDREMRRRALWQHYGRRWESEDRGDSGVLSISYRDGFPDLARLGPQTNFGSPLLGRYPIETLVAQAVPGLLDAIADSPLLETVRDVRLYSDRAWISEDELVAFLNAPELARLEGLSLQLGDDGGMIWSALARLRRLAALKRLAVDTPLDVEHAGWLGRSCPALEELSYGFALEDPLAALAATATFRLRSLHLNTLHEGGGSIAAVLAAPLAAELAELTIFDAGHEGSRPAPLTGLPCAASLRHLRVRSFQGEAYDYLREARFPALETLDISDRTADDLVDVVAVSPTLTALELGGGAEITQAHVERIMSSLPHLVRLALSNVHDNAARAIARSEPARRLRHLSLDGGTSTPGAIVELVRSGRLNELRGLALSSSMLDPRAVRTIADGPFDRMAQLRLPHTSGYDIAAILADAWLPCGEADTYERELELSGRAVDRRVR